MLCYEMINVFFAARCIEQSPKSLLCGFAAEPFNSMADLGGV